MNDGRVRWHEDFRETAGDTGSETGELGWETQPTPDQANWDQ